MASTDTTSTARGKEFTGRKMLIVTVGFFLVVIGVNFFGAYKAGSTFPGLEVRNGYVASQQFDRLKAAQLALGWDVAAQLESDQLRLDIIGPDGAPVIPASMEATLGRSTERRQDQNLVFERDASGAFLADTGELDFGVWILWLKATAEDGTLFQQRISLFKPER